MAAVERLRVERVLVSPTFDQLSLFCFFFWGGGGGFFFFFFFCCLLLVSMCMLFVIVNSFAPSHCGRKQRCKLHYCLLGIAIKPRLQFSNL